MSRSASVGSLAPSSSVVISPDGLQPPLASADLLEQARVVHRDPGRAGQRPQHHLVVLGEARPAVLLGEVEPAEHLAARPDRRAEEGAHRGMVGRKSHRRRMFGQLRQPQRLGVLEHHSEHPVAGGQRPDPRASGVVDPDMDELGQHPVRTEHPQRTVTGIDQAHGGPDDLPQRLVQLQPGRDRQHGPQQPVHPVLPADDLLEPTAGHGRTHTGRAVRSRHSSLSHEPTCPRVGGASRADAPRR